MSLGEYISAGSSTTKLLLHANGNLNDDSGNNVVLTQNGGSVTYPNFGKYNSCVNLPGSIVLYNSNNVIGNVGNIDFTLACNLYVTGDQSRGEFFFIGKHSGYNTAIMFSLRTKSGGNNAIYMDYAGNAGFSTNMRVVYNKWNIIIITKSGDDIKVILNGVTESFTKTGLNVTNGPFRISSYNDITAKFTGNIDEYIVENYSWNTQQCQKYYTNALGRFASL